jgi:hypothetical protein
VVESARVDWEAALAKFLRAKKVSKSALESPAMDAVMCLSRLELSRFDLISRVVRYPAEFTQVPWLMSSKGPDYCLCFSFFLCL